MGLMQYVPPPAGENPVWWPISAEQQSALHSKAQILLYGGASGGGKTDFLVADAMQEHENTNLRALLIRKSFQEMGQIQDRCRAIYAPFGAFYRDREASWIFPSGARIRLGFMANDNTISRYQGNPFSWLGMDESTMLPEKQFRDILPWLATTDPALFPRARLTTNPGGIGAAWHMKVFLRDKCPIHFPKESVQSGAIYKGSKWMQDGEPVNKTVSFIQATVESNPLYGADKIDSLRSQTAERREQLLKGCWCALEGMYFAFLNQDYRVPIGSVKEPWWATHFLSMDYGFSNSAAACGLYFKEEESMRWPAGRIIKVGEIVERKMGSVEFAERVINRFITERQIQGRRPQISACYFDPAMDAHTGTGQSNAEMMDEIFEKYEVPMISAAKDRIGNAQKAYHLLKTGEFGITDACPKTWTSFTSRMHDPKMPGAVLKVHGEDLDDIYDETVYGLNTFVDVSIKPAEDGYADRLKQMQEAGMDEHSLGIYRMRYGRALQEEEESKNAPARFGRGRRVVIRR
jgi:hypothetical protein